MENSKYLFAPARRLTKATNKSPSISQDAENGQQVEDATDAQAPPLTESGYEAWQACQAQSQAS